MNRSVLHRLTWWIAPLTVSAFSAGGLGAQEGSSTDYIVRRIPCWTTTMEFYDPAAFPRYSVQGYFFDANPFTTTRWLDGNTSMIMRSTRGTSLVDASGRYRWTDARIRVTCHVREYLWGLISQPYAIVQYELGTVEPISTACGEKPVDPGGGIGVTSRATPAADLLEPAAMQTDCSGTGGGEAGGSGLTCRQEYVVVEISYDGGVTWEEYWSGWATTCEVAET